MLIDRDRGDREIWVRNVVDWGDMSLFESDSPGDYNFLASDALRTSRPVLAGVYDMETAEIYGPFLQAMAAAGYHEYELNDSSDTFIPGRLKPSECDETQSDDGPTPNLFVFPYDWRQDNSFNASLLKDYIACIRQIHPSTDVNIVAHSMGGLPSRRYILQNSSNHHINAYISIASPFLGAPKLVYVLESGHFLDQSDPFVDPIFKHTTRSFPGAHQLLPSSQYFELGGAPPLVEGDREIHPDADGPLDFDQMVWAINAQYGEESLTPGAKGDEFHQGGQDDWRFDTTGIKYHHITGKQRGAHTVGQMKTTWTQVCTGVLSPDCSDRAATVEITKTEGDGTVPLLSAQRAGTSDINATDAQFKTFGPPPNESANDLYSHNGLMSNPEVQQKVFEWLSAAEPASPSSAQAARPRAASPSAPVPYHDVTIAGASAIAVSDSAGNNTDSPAFLFRPAVPGVYTYSLGSGVRMVSVPISTTTDYFIAFDSTDDPVSVEVRIGTSSTTTRAIRYQDLVLPTGVSARLSFTAAEPQDLAYDSDGNGSFETTVQPTVDVTGAAAEDTDAPVISVIEDIQGGSSHLSLSAEDPSGVSRLLFSLDGTSYQEYIGPLTLTQQQTPVLYANADDTLANRATLVHTLTTPLTPIPSVAWWAMVFITAIVAGLGYLRIRRIRA